MKKHVEIALSLTGITFVVYLTEIPGPPLRVDLAALVSLLIGFTMPALMVRGWCQHVQRFAQTAALQLGSCIVLDLFFAVTIVKWEFSLLPSLTFVGIGFVGLEALLLTHVALVELCHRFLGVKIQRV
jgi:hypothetical protein